jgi:hypothetical protein
MIGNPLKKTYYGDTLNIYCPDRSALIKSFQVYFTIDFMVRNRKLGTFPIVEEIVIDVDRKEELKMSAA